VENYGLVESGIVFGLKDRADFEKLKYPTKLFALHGAVIDFVENHLEEYKEPPSLGLLMTQFPDLIEDGKDLNFDYCLDEFEKQVVYREVVKIIKANQGTLREDPKKAIRSIILSLDDVDIDFADDISVYDNGTNARLDEYLEKKEERKLRKLIGIPTPFRTINRTGVGWLPGDLISIFARPTVGKSWLAAKTAAVAVKGGYKVLYLTTEMTVKSTSLRMDVLLAQMHGYTLNHHALRKGDPINEQEYAKFLSEASNKRLLISDSMGDKFFNLSTVLSQTRKYKPDLLIIDGIELLSSDSNSVWEKMMELFYGVKNLCITQNIAAFVSTQASKKAQDLFTLPRPEDVAFGDALIRASDIAMSMCLSEDSDNEHILAFQKYRDDQPPASVLNLFWDVNSGNIREMDQNELERVTF